MSVFRFIAAEWACHSVKMLCSVLGVSRSGFHAWVVGPPSPRAIADAASSERVRELQAASRRTCGSPRIYRDLRAVSIETGELHSTGQSTHHSAAGLVPLRNPIG